MTLYESDDLSSSVQLSDDVEGFQLVVGVLERNKNHAMGIIAPPYVTSATVEFPDVPIGFSVNGRTALTSSANIVKVIGIK